MNKELKNKFVKEILANQGIIHKICRAYTTNNNDHKDLFQEISIQLYKAYPKFRSKSKFSTWMYRVALNTAISLYRKNKRSIKTSELFDNFKELEYKDYDDTKDKQVEMLYKAIHTLNDIEKALCLMYLDDKPYTEIAETLGITEGNARVKMNRTKTKLKKILNP